MSRWVVHAQAAFKARHALTAYKGEVEASHLHDWQVEVRIGADALGPEGYALDFHEVRQILVEALAPLYDSDLNTDPEIGRPSPTAERVAEVLAERLTPQYEAIGGRLLSLSVWEGPDNQVDLILE
jgi:6-pyruvoyl-tetrahydropterin synthase